MSTTPSPVRRRGRGARERILKAATELFIAQGVNATGMDQLAKVADVSKRTLYSHFAGKDELVHAYLSGLEDDLLPTGAAEDGSTPREQLIAVFDQRPSVSGRPLRGCPFLSAAVEIPDPEHPAHRLAAAHKTEFARRLGDLARRAGAHRPEELGEQLALLYDGAAARGTALNSTAPAAHARAMAVTLIDAAIASGGDDTGP
ncbi:TetR/AcrR family transcriptional regulator [Streptomyces sp. NPDC002309]